MSNEFYNASGYPAPRASGASVNARNEFLQIAAAFNKLPTLSGNGGKLLRVNPSATGVETVEIDDLLPDVSYLEKSGGTMSGPITFGFPNAVSGISGDAADTYTVDTDKVIAHYGLTWKNFSDVGAGPAAVLSGYGGVRLHVAGAERLRLDANGLRSPNQHNELRYDLGDGPKLILRNRVVNGAVHKFGSLLFSPYRDVADPAYGAGIWAEGGSAAGFTADLVFGADQNTGAGAFPSERMRLTHIGRLGVGTNDPQTTLHVNPGTAGAIRVGGTGAADWAHFGNDTAGGYVYAPAGKNVRIYAGNAECLNIDPTGIVNVVGDRYITLGPNTSWGQHLRIGGNGNGDGSTARVFTTDGNLHLDAKPGSALYLNYYDGGPVYTNRGGGLEAEVGYRKAPFTLYTGASVLAAVDRGATHYKTDASQVTVPTGVYSDGDVVTILNWSLSNMTIVPGSGMTMYLAGAGGTVGTRTLLGVGAATIVFQAHNACVIQGAVA